MALRHETGTPSFRDLEQQGWHAKARHYDTLLGQVTSGARQPLLDAIRMGAGMRILDVATGPGYVAEAAAARGAEAIGIDFAADMIVEASRRCPGIDFRQGDAENLDFERDSFDAVTCAFGLLHFAEPEKAIAEAHRVLRDGGHYAFTVWASPDQHRFFSLLLGAIKTFGNLQVALPPAPPIFRFADHDECRKALDQAGFADISVTTLPLVWRTTSTDDILDGIYRSTVRTELLLEHQEPEAREKIHNAIREGAQGFLRDGVYEIGWPAVMVSARKPATK